jgi:hypothetical protein
MRRGCSTSPADKQLAWNTWGQSNMRKTSERIHRPICTTAPIPLSIQDNHTICDAISANVALTGTSAHVAIWNSMGCAHIQRPFASCGNVTCAAPLYHNLCCRIRQLYTIMDSGGSNGNLVIGSPMYHLYNNNTAAASGFGCRTRECDKCERGQAVESSIQYRWTNPPMVTCKLCSPGTYAISANNNTSCLALTSPDWCVAMTPEATTCAMRHEHGAQAILRCPGGFSSGASTAFRCTQCVPGKFKPANGTAFTCTNASIGTCAGSKEGDPSSCGGSGSLYAINCKSWKAAAHEGSSTCAEGDDDDKSSVIIIVGIVCFACFVCFACACIVYRRRKSKVQGETASRPKHKDTRDPLELKSLVTFRV